MSHSDIGLCVEKTSEMFTHGLSVTAFIQGLALNRKNTGNLLSRE